MKLSTFMNLIFWLLYPLASVGAFQFSRPIEALQSQQEDLLAVTLDSTLYAHTADGFADLRLVDGDNTEIPYLIDKLRSQRSETVRKSHNARIVSLKESDNHAIEIEFRLKSDDPPAEGLRLFTPLANFEHRVQVFGSRDGRDWNLLVENAIIYDYSKFIDLSNREITLPANPYRWLKVRVEEPIQAYESENLELTRELKQGQERGRSETTEIRRVPLRIDRIEYWYREVQSRTAVDTTLNYPVEAFSASQNEATRSTLIEVTTQRQPLTGFVIQTGHRNFHRRAIVEALDTGQGGKARWREIGNGTLNRVNFRALHRERLRLGFPEQRHRQYRIVIQNDDNPPFEVTGIRAQGKGYRLLFFAEPEKTYALAYGDDSANAPVYDTASLEAALAASYRPTPVELGSEAPGRIPVEKPRFDFARWFNSDLFLGGAIFIVVTILAAALVYAGKRIDQNPDG